MRRRDKDATCEHGNHADSKERRYETRRAGAAALHWDETYLVFVSVALGAQIEFARVTAV